MNWGLDLEGFAPFVFSASFDHMFMFKEIIG